MSIEAPKHFRLKAIITSVVIALFPTIALSMKNIGNLGFEDFIENLSIYVGLFVFLFVVIFVGILLMQKVRLRSEHRER